MDLSFLENMFKLGDTTSDGVGLEMISSTSTTSTSDHLQASPGSSNSSGTAITGNTLGVSTGKSSLLGTKRLQNVGM